MVNLDDTWPKGDGSIRKYFWGEETGEIIGEHLLLLGDAWLIRGSKSKVRFRVAPQAILSNSFDKNMNLKRKHKKTFDIKDRNQEHGPGSLLLELAYASCNELYLRPLKWAHILPLSLSCSYRSLGIEAFGLLFNLSRHTGSKWTGCSNQMTIDFPGYFGTHDNYSIAKPIPLVWVNDCAQAQTHYFNMVLVVLFASLSIILNEAGLHIPTTIWLICSVVGWTKSRFLVIPIYIFTFIYRKSFYSLH